MKHGIPIAVYVAALATAFALQRPPPPLPYLLDSLPAPLAAEEGQDREQSVEWFLNKTAAPLLDRSAGFEQAIEPAMQRARLGQAFAEWNTYVQLLPRALDWAAIETELAALGLSTGDRDDWSELAALSLPELGQALQTRREQATRKQELLNNKTWELTSLLRRANTADELREALSQRIAQLDEQMNRCREDVACSGSLILAMEYFDVPIDNWAVFDEAYQEFGQNLANCPREHPAAELIKARAWFRYCALKLVRAANSMADKPELLTLSTRLGKSLLPYQFDERGGRPPLVLLDVEHRLLDQCKQITRRVGISIDGIRFRRPPPAAAP